LWARPRAYLRVGHLKGASLGQAAALHSNRLERLARDKRSSLS